MRKERVLIAGGVTEAKNGFYRRDDSVHITVNQNKIIRKLINLFKNMQMKLFYIFLTLKVENMNQIMVFLPSV